MVQLLKDFYQTFNVVLEKNEWDDCEDSTSALTTKKRVFKKGNRTPFSIDVCIVKEDMFGLHRLIHQKNRIVAHGAYFWNMVSQSQNLHEREKALKPDYWEEVREKYLDKKNMYLRRPYDHTHPSFVCYVEAVNEVYYKYFGIAGRW